jgi:hypothetical protein
MPFRRKKPPSAEGDDAEENAPDALAAATNYLSFQDATATGIAADEDDLGDTGSAAVGAGGRLRGWFGGRRSNNNGSNAPQQHRGFSTSIHDMFQSPETERIDCCALTCCGMMQSDRDRYFLQGVTPPSLIRRLWLHLLIPVWLLAIAGWAAMRIRDPVLNQVFTTCIVVMLICYFMTQCSKGRSKRIEIRKDLLWTKAQLLDQRRQNLSIILEQERPDDDGDNQEYYLGQTQWDFGMAHPCCLLSCYSEDRLVSRDDDEERPAAANMCTSLWEWTCSPCCGMHIQCCGVCALAQEGREVETALLPRSYLRVDYVRSSRPTGSCLFPSIISHSCTSPVLLHRLPCNPMPITTRLFIKLDTRKEMLLKTTTMRTRTDLLVAALSTFLAFLFSSCKSWPP